MDIYKSGIRPLLFSGLKVDPEWMQQQTIQLCAWMERTKTQLPSYWFQKWLQQTCSTTDPCLEQHLWGLNFRNPVGLAAGFDKDGVATGIWSNFGFGFAELGTVTFHAQPGNARPRLFRLPLDQAAINRMGFNNQGAAQMAAVLAQSRGSARVRRALDLSSGRRAHSSRSPEPQQAWEIPVGINLGKSKVTPLDQAVEDYLASFRLLKDLGDYFVVNVSSPNTPGLRSLQAADQLSPILNTLQQENEAHKPLLVKISPDLQWEDIAKIVAIAQEHHLSGIIATNTTIRREGGAANSPFDRGLDRSAERSRRRSQGFGERSTETLDPKGSRASTLSSAARVNSPNPETPKPEPLKTQIIQATGKEVNEEAGGLSGAPLRQRSTDVIRFIWQQTQGQLPIIGVGGIFTAEDAWEKITAGASLVQVYTGWVYEGPWMVRRILEGLRQKLKAHDLTSLADAVGLEND